jgi:formylglycine-generating enzyme required for sulfatase activity
LEVTPQQIGRIFNMPSLVTLAGIDKAISNLALKDDSLQLRLLRLVRSHFQSDESLLDSTEIPNELIISHIWDISDKKEIKKKEKRFRSLKSSLNRKLRRLSDTGQNPEGIVLSRYNSFTISEQKKDILLAQLSLSLKRMSFAKNMAESSFQILFAEIVQQKGIGALQQLEILPLSWNGASRGPSHAIPPYSGREPVEESNTPFGLPAPAIPWPDEAELELIHGDDSTGFEQVEDLSPDELALPESPCNPPSAAQFQAAPAQSWFDGAEIVLLDDDLSPGGDPAGIHLPADEFLFAESPGQASLCQTETATEVHGLMGTLSEMLGLKTPSPALASRTSHEADEAYLFQILGRTAPAYRRIAAGDYQVGSPAPEGFELPRHSVHLKAFSMAEYLVTNDIFALFVQETGYRTEAEEQGYGLVFDGIEDLLFHTETANTETGGIINLHRIEGAYWRHPAGPQSSIQQKSRHPVVQVSLRDALAFAEWAGKRLPSEEEWEAAAGTTDGRTFPWGHSWNDSWANLLTTGWKDTTEVGRFGPMAASPFGIHDLVGNVYEWTSTVFRQLGGESLQALKGGSWATSGTITVAHRLLEDANHWSNIIGFRCAAD